MEYKFDYKTQAKDFWWISMYSIYRSMAGVCNIIFTLAFIVLTITFWSNVNSLVRILLIFACILFPIIQPFAIYQKARKQSDAVPDNLILYFNSKGICVLQEDTQSDIEWNKVKRIAMKVKRIVIFTTNNSGYLLGKETLGNQTEEFYKYLQSKVLVKKYIK